jgi:hypothetical protein
VRGARLTHIPRVGYVALFPLLLRLLPADAPDLGAALDMLVTPRSDWRSICLLFVLVVVVVVVVSVDGVCVVK